MRWGFRCKTGGACRDQSCGLVTLEFSPGNGRGCRNWLISSAASPSTGVYDEAQHLTMVVGAKTSQQQQEYIKSLANLSGTFVVLAGTFDVLKLLPRNGQLAARMLPIHLARYRAEDPNGWRTFREVVLTFQQSLPLPEQPSLLENAELLYAGSLGVVGLLKCWLNRALPRRWDCLIAAEANHSGIDKVGTAQNNPQGLTTGTQLAVLKEDDAYLLPLAVHHGGQPHV